ncbi:protein ORF99 [Anguillid herpesvirus 1]|uniref:Protein ORF99 n=1 Tax=Anguillid herpesvirus 1 TaxID=150286 RepID=A0A1J0REC7_9VIRU|nr:protein ORF99 [Anguillid herpesvirus 1]ADA57862.1 protein ORF99 [Anguillid herpesvirus 1]APD76263.1 ORF99 [Anguillid herpesvirus 1]QRM16394.1 protein ORF99 [Anguillid herpesvirus 1]QRM16522.1 protein ORF99 [Anguillid herpesvirus 1]QRM16653.1 protein ORF99 [Anguillid herpesvirus 1]
MGSAAWRATIDRPFFKTYFMPETVFISETLKKVVASSQLHQPQPMTQMLRNIFVPPLSFLEKRVTSEGEVMWKVLDDTASKVATVTRGEGDRYKVTVLPLGGLKTAEQQHVNYINMSSGNLSAVPYQVAQTVNSAREPLYVWIATKTSPVLIKLVYAEQLLWEHVKRFAPSDLTLSGLVPESLQWNEIAETGHDSFMETLEQIADGYEFENASQHYIDAAQRAMCVRWRQLCLHHDGVNPYTGVRTEAPGFFIPIHTSPLDPAPHVKLMFTEPFEWFDQSIYKTCHKLLARKLFSEWPWHKPSDFSTSDRMVHKLSMNTDALRLRATHTAPQARIPINPILTDQEQMAQPPEMRVQLESERLARITGEQLLWYHLQELIQEKFLTVAPDSVACRVTWALEWPVIEELLFDIPVPCMTVCVGAKVYTNLFLPMMRYMLTFSVAYNAVRTQVPRILVQD